MDARSRDVLEGNVLDARGGVPLPVNIRRLLPKSSLVFLHLAQECIIKIFINVTPRVLFFRLRKMFLITSEPALTLDIEVDDFFGHFFSLG